MQYIVTKKEVQAIDGYSIDKMGIPAEVLMERAALCIAEQVEKLIDKKGKFYSL